MESIQDNAPTEENLKRRLADILGAEHVQLLPTIQDNGRLEKASVDKWVRYLTECTKEVSKAALEEADVIKNMPKILELMTKELDQLRLEKQEEEWQNGQWEAIYAMRAKLLQYPAMATAFFDTTFLTDLGKKFNEKFETLKENIEDVRVTSHESKRQAFEDITDYVENGEFNDRLRDAINTLMGEQDRALEEKESFVNGLTEQVTALSNEMSALRLEKDQEVDELESTISLVKKDQSLADENALKLNRDLVSREEELEELKRHFSDVMASEFIRSRTISTKPVKKLSDILRQAEECTEEPSDPNRILDATNSDLASGAQLIADIHPGVFIFRTTKGLRCVFDSDDSSPLQPIF